MSALRLLHLLTAMAVYSFVPGVSAFTQTLAQTAPSTNRPTVSSSASSEANRLLKQGFQQLYTSQLQDAINSFQLAIEQFRQSDNQSGEAAALLGQAEAYLWSGRFQDELAAAQQALEIYQALQDRSGEAAALHTIGDTQLNLQQFDEGLASLQQALPIRREVNDRQGEGWTIGLIGIGQVKKGDPAQGLANLQESIAILQEPVTETIEQLQQSYRQGVILAWIGEAYRQQSEYEQANEFLRQALTLTRSVGNRSVEKLALFILGALATDQNQPDAGIAAYQQAQTLAAQTGNQTSQGWALYRIGEIYKQQEQYPQALESFQQALSVFQAIENQSAQAEAFYAIAGVYREQEQYPQALENYQQSLTLFRSLNNRTGEFNLLESIGYTYIDAQQYDQARLIFQQKLEMARQTNDRSREAFGIWGIGDTYGRQAQRLYANGAYAEAVTAAKQAVELYQQALVLAEAAEFKPDLVEAVISVYHIAYMTQGFSFNQQQQFPEAIAAFQQALDVLETYRDRLSEPDYLEDRMDGSMQLANAYSNNGQNAEALVAYQAVEQIAAQLNDPAKQLQAMGFVSYTHSNLGNYDEALTTAQQMVTLAREQLPDDAEAEVSALIKLGRAYSNLGQYPAELEQYQQALPIAKQLNDISTEISLLNNIAVTYSAQGRYFQMLETQQQAVALQQNAIEQIQTNTTESFEQFCASYPMEDTSTRQQCLKTYRHGLAVSLNNLVSAYGTLGRYPEALAAHEQALSIVQEYKTLNLEASLLLNVGNVHSTMGNHAKALEVYQQSLEITTTTGDRPTQLIVLNNIGGVYQDQGKYPEALEVFQRSLKLAQEIGAPASEATVLNNIGSVYSTQGRKAEALTAYQQSLAIRQQLGIDISTNLNSIAILDSDQGRNAEALEKLQQALTIAQTSGDRQMETVVLGNIAVIYGSQADYAKAIELNQQSLAIRQEIGARSDEIFGLVALGRNYHDLGQYDKALELHQQALNLSREIGERPQEALALGNIGRVYLEQKQYSQALTFYEQGLQIAREIGEVATEAALLDAIGRTYERQEQFDRAIEIYQQALKIEREIGYLLAEAATLRGLGTSYAAQGKQTEALEALQQALTIQRQIEAPAGAAQTLASLGKFFVDQNQPELAIVFYKQSVNVTEAIRQKLGGLPQEQQSSYTETIADTYRELADLLLQNDRILEAQQVLDLLKIQELEDYLQNVRGSETTARGIPNRPPEQQIQTGLDALSENAFAISRELSQLRAIPPSQLSPAQQNQMIELGRQTEQLSQQFRDFLSSQDVQERIAELRNDTDGETLELANYADLRNSLRALQQNAVLLYPLVLEDRLELVLVTPNATTPIRKTVQVDRATLNQTISDYQTALKSPTSDPLPLAQKLHEWLIQPLEAELQAIEAETIIYAPDGALRYIPLAALHDGEQWLVQRFRVNNITAASLTDLAPVPQRDLQIFAAAFSEGRHEIPANSEQFYSGLEFAGREVENLAALIPNTTQRLNADFNLDTVYSMNSYSIVHLATHAAFLPTNPVDSFIVFGDGKSATLSQIQTWDLSNVELVVLSACETGLGNQLGDGREILGLGYQIQRAGARAVIASLWQVNDGGTQMLMNAFYHALEDGMTKAEAIRQAQLALITGDLTAVGDPRGSVVAVSTETGLPTSVSQKLNHPYYWAPFILIGNGL